MCIAYRWEIKFSDGKRQLGWRNGSWVMYKQNMGSFRQTDGAEISLFADKLYVAVNFCGSNHNLSGGSS